MAFYVNKGISASFSPLFLSFIHSFTNAISPSGSPGSCGGWTPAGRQPAWRGTASQSPPHLPFCGLKTFPTPPAILAPDSLAISNIPPPWVVMEAQISLQGGRQLSHFGFHTIFMVRPHFPWVHPAHDCMLWDHWSWPLLSMGPF